MPKRSPHYEIVRGNTTQPFHVRFVAGNGEITWTTESYTRRSSAKRAIAAHTRAVLQAAHDALVAHADAIFRTDAPAQYSMMVDFKLAAEKLLSKDLAIALPVHDVDERF